MNSILKSKTLLIAKKELDRFFGDRRMVLSALILPCVLLYFVYAFLVPIMMNLIIGENNKSKIYAINAPVIIQTLFEYAQISLFQIHDDEKEDILTGISQKDGNFLLIFPPDFHEKAAIFEISSGQKAPEINFYYNSMSDGFLENYSKITAILNTYERTISKKFDINLSEGGDLAYSGETGRNFLASILPMFLLVFIYHGAIASTTEAITGEKERGTLSTILITPITPIELAIGKISGLSIESFLCGISGALGILLSLPKFVESLNARLTIEQDLSSFLKLGVININQYSILDIIALIIVLLSCSLFMVTLIAIVSIHAKTAKEAQMLLSPMIIILMLVGLLSTLNNSDQKEAYYYFIPIYNSVQCIDDIFNRLYKPIQVFTTIFSNVFITVIGTVILSRLFKNEKIMSVS